MSRDYSKLLDGKTAVVTYGDCAIGRAVAGLFAQHGARVIIGVKDADAGQEIIGNICDASPESFWLPCDLTDSASVEGFCAEINRRAPLVNALVNNPWVEFDTAFEEADEADDDMLLQAYQHSIVQTLRAFWPAMLKNERCSVINISYDIAKGTTPGSNMQAAASGGKRRSSVSLAVANGAIGGMTRVPAVEGGHHEVRVNEIQAPFCINATAGRDADAIRKNAYDVAGAAAKTAAGIANAALFLASDMASYVSGITLHISAAR